MTTRPTTRRRPGTPGTGTNTVTKTDPTIRRRPGTPRALMNQRAEWNSRIANGEYVECRRCHQAISPGDKWELGHPTDRPYASGNIADDLAPEHSSCNKSGLTTNTTPTFGW
ncbi:MAG: hypothetical protein J2P17_08240 [Mycobacterium sp.]|nr:hypothetical protein [Mycobacterium sp.]